MSAKNDKIDRDALHKYLFDRCDVHGKVRVVQKLLANELDVTHYTIGRIFKEFVQEGRMRKIGKEQHNVSTYVVYDPAAWRAGQPGPPRRQIVWG